MTSSEDAAYAEEKDWFLRRQWNLLAVRWTTTRDGFLEAFPTAESFLAVPVPIPRRDGSWISKPWAAVRYSSDRSWSSTNVIFRPAENVVHELDSRTKAKIGFLMGKCNKAEGPDFRQLFAQAWLSVAQMIEYMGVPPTNPRDPPTVTRIDPRKRYAEGLPGGARNVRWVGPGELVEDRLG